MKDWFSDLDKREKIFVAGGAVVVFVAILFALHLGANRQGPQVAGDERGNLAERTSRVASIAGRPGRRAAPPRRNHE